MYRFFFHVVLHLITTRYTGISKQVTHVLHSSKEHAMHVRGMGIVAAHNYFRTLVKCIECERILYGYAVILTCTERDRHVSII